MAEKTELEQLKIQSYDIFRSIEILQQQLQAKSRRIAELEAKPKE